jgi:NAD(P)-dependent dehydrogenase (short-subunit alcohol dehydrogenase family)
VSAPTQTVVITGAAGHLGRAVAAAFRERGAQLVLAGRHVEELEHGGPGAADTLLLPLDLLDRERVRSGIAQAVARFGGIDVLCHIAGGFRMGEAVHEISDGSWDFLMDVNARTLVNVAAAVVPHLLQRGGGKIVTVGAAAAGHGAAHMGAYCASKSALIRLTEAMSAELKDKGINVNCVLPSIIDTPDNRVAMPDADPSRWVTPQALANVIVFLASDAASAIHGAALPVTGLT